MRRRAAYWIIGVLLILIGLFMPRGWYDTLPKHPDLPPPPFKGVTLLQFSFVLEGLALIWLSLKRRTFARLREVERLPVSAVSEESEAGYKRIYLWLVAAITLLAFFLRLLHLNSDLWLDEIWPILTYGQMSALEVLVNNFVPGNHFLNTLLVSLAVMVFGEQEWAIRLPAVIFGTATIPAVHWVARLALSRRASLGVALLLAVSYHHIFFSQNARGYTAYLLFSLLSSGLFVRGLQEDRARIWVLYVVTMLLNFASMLISGFVFASHILVGAVALLVVRPPGAFPIPLLRRLTGVFVVTAFLGFQLYAVVLPQVYVYVQTVYGSPSGGYPVFSNELLKELIRGISAGFGTGIISGALPFLLVGSAGFVVLFQRQWTLSMALTLPGILTAIFLIVNGLNFYPRFFLVAIPLVILAAVQGIHSFSRLVGKIIGKGEDIFSPRLTTALILAVCVISLVSLRQYYSVPKQAYRASIQYLEAERKSGEIIIVIDLAESGYRYYGERLGLKEGKDVFFVRSVEALEAVLSSHGEKRSFLVTTLPRLLRIRNPDLDAQIRKNWTIVRTFPGTIGDGEISVWKHRYRRRETTL